MKQQPAVLFHQYLRVISGSFQFAASRLQGFVELHASYDGFPIDRGCQSVELCIGWVQHDQSMFGEQRSEYARECFPECCIRLVATLQQFHSFSAYMLSD